MHFCNFCSIATIRLDKIIHINSLVSRNIIKRAIVSGNCTINSITILEPSYKVKPKSNIFIKFALNKTTKYQLEPMAINLDIIYQDQYLLAINKEPNIAVHPSANDNITIVNGLAYLYPYESFGDTVRPFITHRLDKNTSGALLAAKNKRIMDQIIKSHHKIHKEYLAIVHGKLPSMMGVIDGPITRDTNNRTKMKVGGHRNAITEYAVLDSNNSYSLIRCIIKTGRTHQIRVHLSYLGNPIVGDSKYCNLPIGKPLIARQALHAYKISFIHPINKNRLSVIAPLKSDMHILARVCSLKLTENIT